MFTICGHLLLYQFFVYKADRLFNYQVSQNRYNINDLVEIKVPLKISLAKNWQIFEPINGQIQFKNTCYNYVKLKLTKDTTYLVCIPNYEKTRLYQQNIINAKNIDDVPVNKKEHIPFGKSLNLSSYNFTLINYRFSPLLKILKTNNFHSANYPIERYRTIPELPPKC